MKQEEKDLLLKDLCGRLPYGVIVAEFDEDCQRTSIALPLVSLENDFSFYGNLKPYLFPLSSMTEEQKEELKELCDMYDPYHDYDSYENWGVEVFKKHIHSDNYKFTFTADVIDWLNKHHFDYRGLIEKGLAIDATTKPNVYK